MHENSVNDTTTQPSDHMNAALADFGDSPAARRRGQEGRKRWRESVKAVAPRQHVVHTRTSAPDDHNTRDVERPATFTQPVDEWKPRHRSVMTMDMALRELEFPSRLVGAEWTVE